MVRRGRGGFSLVELLVVLSVISLLLGLALPVLSQVRSMAQRMNCLSNLRQIGVGMQAYRMDNDDMMPAVQSFSVDPHQPDIVQELDGYLDEGDVWRCPSNSERGQYEATDYEYMLGFYLVLARDGAERRRMQAELDRIDSRVPVMSDAEGWHSGGPEVDRNASYLDGRADWFFVPDEDDIETEG